MKVLYTRLLNLNCFQHQVTLEGNTVTNFRHTHSVTGECPASH